MQRPRSKTRQQRKPAPSDLHIVQDFINTAELEAGTDELSRPQAPADRLAFHSLLPTGTRLDGDDLRRAVAFRESLRSLIAAGDSAGRELGTAVDRAASSALLRARFGAGGVLVFEPVADGVDAAIGRLLAIIAASQRDGFWPRFKVCVHGACRGVFYDYSTNRSTLWCLSRCGSKIRARGHRRRKQRSGH